jgi:hypothetical protein
MRTMALETSKIVNKIAPVCLQNLVSVKNSKYHNQNGVLFPASFLAFLNFSQYRSAMPKGKC